MPEEGSTESHELLYAIDEVGRLVLVPGEVAEDIFHARESLPHCRTWGDARRELSGKYFGELVDEFMGFGEEAPADDEPLDPRSLVAGEDWPGIFYDDLSEADVDEIVSWFNARRFGGTEALLAVLGADDWIAFLRESGIRCEEDPAILNLLNY